MTLVPVRSEASSGSDDVSVALGGHFHTLPRRFGESQGSGGSGNGGELDLSEFRGEGTQRSPDLSAPAYCEPSSKLPLCPA